jgi:hypothetical protein
MRYFAKIANMRWVRLRSLDALNKWEHLNAMNTYAVVDDSGCVFIVHLKQ